MTEEPISIIGSYSSDWFSACLSDYRVGLNLSWHSHEQLILTLILTGYAREQVGCEDVIAGPFKIGLKPAGLRHTDHFWPHGLRALRVSLSPSFLAEQRIELRTIDRWDWIIGSPAVGPLLRLARCLRRGERKESELAENLYESLAGLIPVESSGRDKEAPLWLRRAREHLDSAYSSGVRLTQLAREAHVHPVYFARQFRRYFGCSVGRYVRQLQFREAATMLGDSKTDIAQVASSVGFSDQAHLTRALSAEFGITPGQLRRLLT